MLRSFTGSPGRNVLSRSAEMGEQAGAPHVTGGTSRQESLESVGLGRMFLQEKRLQCFGHLHSPL